MKLIVKISFRPSWWQGWRDKIPGIDEFQMRGLLLMRDRCEEWEFEGKGVAIDGEGIQLSIAIVEDQVQLQKIGEFKRQMVAELEALPNLNSAQCPCGCGSDLSIRDCWRKRVRAHAGEVVIESPAVAIRDSVFPEHTGHPLMGWARDSIRNVIVTACGCGEALDLPIHTVNQIEDIGGSFGQAVYQAIRDSYERVAALHRAPPMSQEEREQKHRKLEQLQRYMSERKFLVTDD